MLQTLLFLKPFILAPSTLSWSKPKICGDFVNANIKIHGRAEVVCLVSVLRSQWTKNESLPKDLVLETLVRFKQLKKWNLVSEILEWLRTQHWWHFNEMDFLMLITAHGKQGDFNKAKRVLSYMTKKGYASNMIFHTALMEAYGRGGQYNKAEAIFPKDCLGLG
ncbi:Pentatricopeptide repeat-containing protein [Camellia lanceoleosa]|uniref:Pentatricopeptide repeat-containing protein n=1 Tax=Camellia lanceoleosa TaxID=1840588 RepID=A0ACC0FXH7_9ERIC|nr:Pentatricopeptide repeat-containing protein [Camellia lanceoleosa]